MNDWSKAQNVLMAALEKEGAERKKFLAACQKEDPELYREVQSLLQYASAAELLTDHPARNLITEACIGSISPTSLVGRKIGPFFLESLLGEGGMGMVFRARQEQPLKRTVALKIVKTHLNSSELKRRFEYECQVLALMSHPHIAQVYEAGETDGRPFFVMEFVDGMPLPIYCKTMKYGIEQRLILFLQVCDAVGHAHRKGVIHRDIKPSNVLVSADGSGVRVIDFGIAKAETPLLDGHSMQTRAGMLVGTPAYMSPEQAGVLCEDVDTRSDIYSLGVLLYELLTDELPFGRVEDSELPLKQFLNQLAENIPIKPSHRLQHNDKPDWDFGGSQGKELARRCKGDLDWIILKALAREPDQRYAGVAEMSNDLQHFLRNEPVSAGPPGTFYILKKLASKYRVQVGAILLILMALLGGGTLAILGLMETNRARANLMTAQSFGGDVEAMENILERAYLIPRHNISREKEMVRKRMEKIRTTMAQLKTSALGPGHYALGRGYLSLLDYESAVKELEKAYSHHYQNAAVSYALGVGYGEIYRERLDEGRSLGDPAERAARREALQSEFLIPAIRHLNQASAYQAVSPHYLEGLIHFYNDAHQEGLAALAMAIEEKPGLQEPRLLAARILQSRGKNFREQGQKDQAFAAYNGAETYYAEAVRIGEGDIRCYLGPMTLYAEMANLWRIGPGTDTPRFVDQGLAVSRHALEIEPENDRVFRIRALLHTLRGDYEMNNGHDPSDSFDQAWADAERAQTINPGEIRNYLMAVNAGFLQSKHLFNRGKNTQAINQKTIEAAQKGLALNPSDISMLVHLGYTLLNRGHIALSKGGDPSDDIQASRLLHERMLKIGHKSLKVYDSIGQTYYLAGRYEISQQKNPDENLTRAQGYYRKALELNPNSVPVNNNLGLVYVNWGRYTLNQKQDPEPMVNQALEQLAKVVAINPEHEKAYGNMGLACLLMIRHLLANQQNPEHWTDRAVAYYEQAIALNPNSFMNYNNAGNAYGLQGVYLKANQKDPRPLQEKSAALFQRGLEQNPDSWLLLINAACGCGEMGRADEASKLLRRAFALDKKYARHLDLKCFDSIRETPVFRQLVMAFSKAEEKK